MLSMRLVDMRAVVLAAGVILLAAACSSGGGDSTATSPSPTGDSGAEPTLAADELQPPPLPTCPPDGADEGSPQLIPVECPVLQLRTVTIELWSCEDGPCARSEESNCQRSVSLEFDDPVGQLSNSPGPEPFFCIVQFHAVPDFTYVVRVSRRVACGPACDGFEMCAALASENHIAIVPVAKGECPVRVIS